MNITSMTIEKGSWGNYILVCSDGRTLESLGDEELLEKIKEILNEKLS